MTDLNFSRSYTHVQVPGLVDDRPVRSTQEGAVIDALHLQVEREALNSIPVGLRECYGRGKAANQMMVRALTDKDLDGLNKALGRGADPNLVVRMRSTLSLPGQEPVFEDAPVALLAVTHWGERAGEALGALEKAGANFTAGVNFEGGYALVVKRPAPMYEIGQSALQETMNPIDVRAYAAFQKFAPQAVAAGYLHRQKRAPAVIADADELAMEAMLTLTEQIQNFRDREREGALKNSASPNCAPLRFK